MIDRAKLLSDLQVLLRKLEADLLERAGGVEAELRSEYEGAQKAERTAQSFEEWRSDAMTQMAVAWVLSGVFVRFLEDNQLIDPPMVSGSTLTPSPSPQAEGDMKKASADMGLHPLLPREKGAGGMRENRLQRARDEHELYFQSHPKETDREYWLMVFGRLAQLPGAREVFGEKNRVWALPSWLSGDGAGELLRFFQRVEPETGRLVHDFADEQWNTRFLGDLYQDLSEAARKKFALLQTPDFVESFILDRTLEPAIEEFTLTPSPSPWGEGDKRGTGSTRDLLPLLPGEKGAGGMRVFRMIDPACGSGHFLLGSFGRLLDRWLKKEPGTNVRELVQRSLDSIYGVDINPYAVAIARFRLLLVAMKASGIKRLQDAPGFRINLACGDSLLHGEGTQLELEDVLAKAHHYKSEDIAELNRILVRGHYHAVVANPPYIVPKDAKANEAYRKLYKETCYRQYSLAVPFFQRMYSLAVAGGFTGQITANSFMKREFGKRLIENFVPSVDLTDVIDTSGAYIPGHGTPTVILFGRNRQPVAGTIRTVMGIRGEPSTPENPAEGLVWSAILKQVDCAGSQSEFVSVADSVRASFCKHPWSIGGGGASDLKEYIDGSAKQTLSDLVNEIGFAAVTREDDVYLIGKEVILRQGISSQFIRPLVAGEDLRDWAIQNPICAVWSYNASSLRAESSQPVVKFLWLWKQQLSQRVAYGHSQVERGLTWFEYSMFFEKRYAIPKSIAFAFVASHNHFVLDRGGKVFKQSAPVIKLPADATEDDHLALLGLLNSSTGAFWMRQVFHDKGGGGIGGGIATEAWEHFFEYDGTKIKAFPIPKYFPVKQAKYLDTAVQQWYRLLPHSILNGSHASFTPEFFQQKKHSLERMNHTMISLQEELDWQCYQLYGLTTEAFTHPALPPIALGQRAFEIVMARKIAAGELQTTWFERHNSTPITELPSEWSAEYKQLVQRRIEMIESDKNIALIEQPEYKRRWNAEPWDSQLERALKNWLLDRLERYFDFDGRMCPHPPTPSPQGEGEPNQQRINQDNPPLHAPPSPWGEGGWEGEGISRIAGQLRQIPKPLLQRARELRQTQTPAEELLWECLRDRRFLEAKFRRQHNIGQYIADFYCHAARLVIELDGEIHQTQLEQDRDRNQWMQDQGLIVLRFSNDDLSDRFAEVLSAIAAVLDPHPPTPSPQGEGEPNPSLSPHPPTPSPQGEGEPNQAVNQDSPPLHAPPSPWGEGGWEGEGKPLPKTDITLISLTQLTDLARQDPQFLQVAELYRNDPSFNLQKLITELVEAESVPLLPILCYKPTGLRKRTEWEHTWEKQRQEDAIDDRTQLPKDHPDHLDLNTAKTLKQNEVGTIPVPPKYASTDFQKSHYWRLRGKLDVPKERWITFPHSPAEDGTPTIAWAGYDHLQLALAISAYFVEIQENLGGRDDPRLLPLLASLQELLPWLKQWHNHLDPTYNQPMGDYIEAFLQDEARQLGKTLEEVRSWQPPNRTKRRR